MKETTPHAKKIEMSALKLEKRDPLQMKFNNF